MKVTIVEAILISYNLVNLMLDSCGFRLTVCEFNPRHNYEIFILIQY